MTKEGSAMSFKSHAKRLSGLGRNSALKLRAAVSSPKPSQSRELGNLPQEDTSVELFSQQHHVRTPPAEVEHWVQAYRRNIDSTLIYNVPEEILLGVMKHLQPDTMYFFRQTCLLFRRLSNDREFRHLKVADDAFEPGVSYPYPTLNIDGDRKGIPMFSIVQMHEIRDHIRQQSFCEQCRQAMLDVSTSKRPEVLLARLNGTRYCGGCLVDHQDMLFSEDQRQTQRAKALCIGRQGYIRVCNHLTVSWDDVEKVLKSGEGKEFRCQHRSHGRNIPSKQQKEVQKAHGHAIVGQIYPLLHVERITRPWHPKYAVQIRLKWLIVPFQNLNADQPVTRGVLRANLAAIDLKQIATLCPHEAFDDVKFLRAFEPACCACVRRDSPTDHDLSRCGRKACCLCFSVRNEGRCVGKLLATEATCSSGNSAPDVEHRSSCSCCSTSYKWERANDVVMLSRNSSVLVETPADPAWVRLLDSGSYDLQDQESKNIYWCDDPKCATSRQWKTRLALTRWIKHGTGSKMRHPKSS